MGKNFKLDEIPDMTGKVCIVTGGNTGVSNESFRCPLTSPVKLIQNLDR